jgi:hypothetical protein
VTDVHAGSTDGLLAVGQLHSLAVMRRMDCLQGALEEAQLITWPTPQKVR